MFSTKTFCNWGVAKKLVNACNKEGIKLYSAFKQLRVFFREKREVVWKPQV